MLSLLRRPGFRRLLVGQGVSALGDWMGTFAFMALALSLTGSPSAVGGVLALRLLPAALGGPLAARAASRWDRRHTMLTMDTTRAVMIALVPLVRALWWLYLWAFLVEVASLVFLPARDASIPDLVDDDQLATANGLVLGSSYVTIPLGAAVFAVVSALPLADALERPHALVFWLDAASYVVSFALIARVYELLPRSAHAAAPVEEPVRFREAFAIPLVRAVVPAAAAVAVGLGALFSLGIVYVRDVLDASDTEFGWLVALFGVGAAGGLAMLQSGPAFDPLRRTRIGVATIGVVVAAFSLAPWLWLAYLGAVAFGGAAAYTLASGMGLLQARLDGRERVLAFAAFHVVIRVGLAAAAVGAGAAGDLVESVHWPVVGRLAPSRLVLLCSGVLVLCSATLVRERRKE
ncbi:MAG: MFS transporter [Acidimicrobiia bacterium]